MEDYSSMEILESGGVFKRDRKQATYIVFCSPAFSEASSGEKLKGNEMFILIEKRLRFLLKITF